MYSTMQEWVFPFIKNLHGDKESAYSKYMGDAIFKVPTPLMLDKIVTTMDAIYEQMEQITTPITRETRRQLAMAAMGIMTELVRKSKKSRNCIPITVTFASGP